MYIIYHVNLLLIEFLKVPLEVSDSRLETNLTGRVDRGEGSGYILSANRRVRRYDEVQVFLENRNVLRATKTLEYGDVFRG